MNDTSYLTQREAAKFLRLSTRTLERYRIDGSGPRFVRTSRRGRILYARGELAAWAEARTFSNTSEADAADQSAAAT